MKNKKILNNTLMLYTRQILIILVSLYSIRIVLDVLGVDDYGIYSVVAGIVTLCTFLTGSMSSATQRFFSYALGKKNSLLLKSTFSVNVIIYAGIGVLVLALLEGGGYWLVKHHLNIPIERTASAINLYHYSVLAFIFNIITVPFIAIIIAHEDMRFFAMVSILEALLKLAVVFILLHLPWDKLELYGLLLFFVSVINSIIYVSICIRKYPECQFRKLYWDWSLLKNICTFTGWTLFGQFSSVLRNQAVTILLNQFFNPGVAAARAIAVTISLQVNLFSSNFNTGLYPSIIKSYASNDRSEFLSLIYGGSKLTFFLMWVFILPLLIEMETILNIWLTILPDQAVVFTRLALIEALIVSISLPLITAARAPGNMKVYELTLGCMQLCILVISYAALNMGYAAESVFIVAIIANLLMFVVRLLIVSSLISLPIYSYLRKVLLPVILIILISLMPVLAINSVLSEGWVYSLINVLCCIFISSLSMYFIGLDRFWRLKIREVIFNKLGMIIK